MEKLLLIMVLFGVAEICRGQSIEQQAATARARCEQRLRDKGCTGVTSTCDIKTYSYNCNCHASSCPANGSGPSNPILAPIRTNGCGPQGPTRCPSGYCCGPASSSSPDNMRICYPPGSPC